MRSQSPVRSDLRDFCFWVGATGVLPNHRPVQRVSHQGYCQGISTASEWDPQQRCYCNDATATMLRCWQLNPISIDSLACPAGSLTLIGSGWVPFAEQGVHTAISYSWTHCWPARESKLLLWTGAEAPSPVVLMMTNAKWFTGCPSKELPLRAPIKSSH